MKNEQLRMETISKVVEMIEKMNELLPKNYLFIPTWSEFPNFIDVTASAYRDNIMVGNNVSFKSKSFYEDTTSDDLDEAFKAMSQAILEGVYDDIEKEGEQ